MMIKPSSVVLEMNKWMLISKEVCPGPPAQSVTGPVLLPDLLACLHHAAHCSGNVSLIHWVRHKQWHICEPRLSKQAEGTASPDPHPLAEVLLQSLIMAYLIFIFLAAEPTNEYFLPPILPGETNPSPLCFITHDAERNRVDGLATLCPYMTDGQHTSFLV